MNYDNRATTDISLNQVSHEHLDVLGGLPLDLGEN